jgi:LysM repeat protein
MMPKMTGTRFGRLAALMLAGIAVPAQAQAPEPPCPERHVVQEGESLSDIAQRCDMALAQIIARNPQLGNPPQIAPGTELELGVVPETDAAGRMEIYKVQVGDTLQSMARDLNVSLVELMAANPNVDPGALSIGEELAVPGDRPAATVSVLPESAAPGEIVGLRVRQLRPNDWVTIGVGPRASEWRAMREAQATEEGELSTQVPVPDWASPGERLVFVVDTDRGLSFKSAPFLVAKPE